VVYNGKCQYGDVTVWSKGKNEIECHIHNFNKDIYGKRLKITGLNPVKYPFMTDNDHCKLAKRFI
jgi:FAD synthase